MIESPGIELAPIDGQATDRSREPLAVAWTLVAIATVLWFLFTREFPYFYGQAARIAGLIGELRSFVDLGLIGTLYLLSNQLGRIGNARRRAWALAFWTVYGAFIWLYLVHRIAIPNLDAETAKSPLIRMFLSPVFGYCVFRVARVEGLLERFLGKLALIFAVMAFLDFMFAALGFGSRNVGEIELGASPAALSFLFAVFWYAGRIVLKRGSSWLNGLLLFFSAGDSILIFWKAVLPSAFVGLAVVVFVALAHDKAARRMVAVRICALAVGVVLLIAVADIASGNRVSQYAMNRIEKKILRTDSQSYYTGWMAVLDRATTGRLVIWQAGWKKFSSRIYYGNGFSEQYKGGLRPVLYENGYLDLALSLGLGGLLLGIGVIAIWVIKVYPQKQVDPLLRAVVFAYVVALALYNMGIVSRQFDTSNLMGVMVLAIGADLASGVTRREERQEQ